MSQLRALKQQLREQALAARGAQLNAEDVSNAIVSRLIALPEFEHAGCILFYLDVRGEVRTRQAVAGLIGQRNKRIVVPRCEQGRLKLFRLESMEELARGAYGILEPRADLRSLIEKRCAVAEVDFIVAPGVAFDRNGGRIGYGKGYYDYLLDEAASHTFIAALAYESQLVEEVPREPHDHPMHAVITERAVYRTRRRG